MCPTLFLCFFFFSDPAPTEFSPFPLPAPLPISPKRIPAAPALGAILRQEAQRRQQGQILRRPRLPQTPVVEEAAPDCRPVGAQARPLAQDRKSTRLNSSHLVISYAVFCLNKKTQ